MPSSEVAAQGGLGTLTITKEGWSQLDLTWEQGNVGSPFRANLSISKYWNILNASIGVTGLPNVKDKGTVKERIYYPEGPRLDVGLNGDDWFWPGVFGHQAQFANETDSVELEFRTINGEKYVYIPLPAGATIDDFKFDAQSASNGSYDYTMTVGDRPTPVWYRNSVGFEHAQTISTKNGQDYIPINSVCVDHVDFLFDNHKDIIGAGDDGALFVVKYNKSVMTGYPSSTSPVYIGQGPVKADLLDCSLEDYNQDISKDLAVSSADGKVYVFKNDGTGNMVPVQTITMNTSLVNEVVMGDVTDDGWGDIVAGYIAGQFYVSKYQSSNTTFSTPIEIPTGQGAMNGIAVADIDINGYTDIVGANENRHWYIVKNNGTGFEKPVWVSCGNAYLNSLSVVDLNWDNAPELVSGSTDGSIYISYNLGGTFEPGTRIRGGTQTMKEIITGDLDLDGDVDIIGLNGDGWVYFAENDFGVIKDGRKLIEVGADQNTIAMGDLDVDNDLDLVTGGKNGFSIYKNTQGPFKQTIGLNDGGVLKQEVQNYLDKYMLEPEDLDPYDNPTIKVPFKIVSGHISDLELKSLSVNYTYRRDVDITTALRLFVKANIQTADHEGSIDVPVQFMTDSVGTLRISNINIQYDSMIGVIIDSPKNGEEFDLNDEVLLRGHSNLDVNCSSVFYGFSWMVNDRIVGHGCQMVINASSLGGVGKHEIRFIVERRATKEQSYTTVMITLIPPSPPIVDVEPKVVAKPGEEFRYQVRATVADPKDIINLSYNLDYGPTGMSINSTGLISWHPKKSDLGKNNVVVSVSDGKDVTTVAFYVQIEGANKISTPFYKTWAFFAAVLLVCVAVGIVIGGTEVGIFGLYSLAFLLYTRLRQEMVLDNFVRGQIYGHICENPGLHLSELKRRLELSNGTLVYHLKTLEREGLVKSYPNGGQRVFFSTKEKVNKELVHLTKAQRWILAVIRENPGISQKGISEETGLSDSTVNRIVLDLKERGMVKMKKGKSTSCFIVEDTCIFLW